MKKKVYYIFAFVFTFLTAARLTSAETIPELAGGVLLAYISIVAILFSLTDSPEHN